MVSLSVARRLITSPTAEPTINIPLTNSPQRMFFSAMNAFSKSARVRRATEGAGAAST